jgi:arylsulfatase A-like enzyme
MLYEGGIRIPWIVRWPGKVEANSTCRTPVISTDCFPTFLEVVGLDPASDQPVDGESILPLLEQSGDWDRKALYFHYPNYAFHKRNRLGGVVREGNFKFIQRYGTGERELYDLASDIGERNNLATSKTKVAERLEGQLTSWLKEMNAAMPTKTSQQ